MNKKILVIDDDSNIAAAIAIRLQASGHDVITAANGVDGLRIAREAKPDLVISDISMPVGNGFSVAYRLRELAPALPVIFLTANKQPRLKEDAVKLGAAGFLEKPYEAAELLTLINKILGEQAKEQPGQAAQPENDLHGTATANQHNGSAPRNADEKKKILIVDEDDKIALSLSIRLKSEGYLVVTAQDAVTGVNAVVTHQPDLVLLDITKPAGNGFSVAERVQSLSPGRTPVIFLTASKQPEYRVRASELGAAGFFEKPYRMEELLPAIQNAFDL